METKKTWKEKHDLLLKNKSDIIKKYNGDVPIKEIAKTYGVSVGCISDNLKLWGVRREHGVKYLLRKMILEE